MPRKIAFVVLAALAAGCLDDAEAQKTKSSTNKTTTTTTTTTTPAPKESSSADVQKIHAEIQKTFGQVPEFIRKLPDAAVPGAWEEYKALWMGQGALPSKYKDLISVGVAAQIPCSYCSYFDQRASKLDGVNDDELHEAVVMAALVRKWSTVLNGIAQDHDAFKSEVRQIMDHAKQGPRTGARAEVTVTDGESALRDIELTLGMVPTFLRTYPRTLLPGAWREMKAFQLSSATLIPNKYKELIGLGVAAQIPCAYCVTFHTEAARTNGATDQEISEALSVAADTRHWSTILNGFDLDMAQFRTEADHMIDYMKKNMGSRGANR